MIGFLFEKMTYFSDYNGPMSNDTFELTSINGVPIFVSEEWRDASNGRKSIADWVYETNKPVAPVCYFKAISHIFRPIRVTHI